MSNEFRISESRDESRVEKLEHQVLDLEARLTAALELMLSFNEDSKRLRQLEADVNEGGELIHRQTTTFNTALGLLVQIADVMPAVREVQVNIEVLNEFSRVTLERLRLQQQILDKLISVDAKTDKATPGAPTPHLKDDSK